LGGGVRRWPGLLDRLGGQQRRARSDPRRGTTLTDPFGVGEATAATIIGHTADIARFRPPIGASAQATPNPPPTLRPHRSPSTAPPTPPFNAPGLDEQRGIARSPTHGSMPADGARVGLEAQEGCSVPTDAIGIPWSGRIALVVSKVLCQVRALDAARDLVTSNALDIKVIGLAWSPRERVDRSDHSSAKTCPGERLQ